MTKWLQRGWRTAAIALVATIAVIFAARVTALQDLGQGTYDFIVDHAGLAAPSKQIVFVDFDDDTFARIGQYPIPRTIFADAINRIAAGKPRVIGLDLLLSEPRTAIEDKAMQDALTNAGMVIIASQANAGTLPPVIPLPIFCQPEDTGAASGFCKEGTPGAMGYAFVNMPYDADGFVRQADLLLAGPPPATSFPLFLAQQYAGESIASGDAKSAIFLKHRIPYSDRNLKTILIGAWGKEPATWIPAWKLLAGEVPASAFADKLVLIGQSSDAARDKDLTPLFRLAGAEGVRLQMSGTAIHAAAIRTLLEGSAVGPAPRLLVWLAVFVVCLLAAALLFSMELGPGLLCVLAMMVAIYGVSLLFYAKLRYWLPFLPFEVGLAFTLPLTLGVQFVQERLISREADALRQQLMTLFSSYVDPAVAATIWERRDEVSLGGEERVATVLFTDIRSFTAMSAGKPPAQVLGWLNRYLAAMDEVIRDHGGFLNKFIGDGLMIIFGLPLSQGVHEDAKRAVQASIAMLQRVEKLNLEAKDNPDLPQLRIGIGMHTGKLMAGSIGSASRQEYSVIGETVNLASRLESLNKPYHTEILLSAAAWEIVSEDFTGFEALGDAKVAGLEEPVAIYTLRI
jgi:class 3 adenylate cyclase